ncbi:pilin [Ramlibacter terrae]|uniref:Pilin n=1 Tax=Ramlibacter terrae TaxID=2732511 RepID=A0ABX6P3D4_9BURK|nr:pilin [Ramlibacter terrae]
MQHSGGTARGFSLLEMMAVLAVIAILALIALPSYMDKIVREQVAESLPLADLAKPAIQAAWLAGAPLPADNAAAGLPAPEKIVGNFVGSVKVDRGAVHIAFGNKAHSALKGKVLTVRPAGVEDARIVPLTWLCGPAKAPAPMVAQGKDQTSVAVALLPIRCR